MTAQRLAVLLLGRLAGCLERPTPADDAGFTYEADYVSEGSVPLSARLPLRADPFPPQRVVPYLRGLLPENDATRQRWAARLGTTADDTFGLLAEMGWDCPGAAQFCRPEEVDEIVGRSSEYEPVDDEHIAARLRRLTKEPASWTMPEEHWSLAGQQEKFALAAVGGGWCEARGGAATTHIVKPGISALLNQALVEHATMRAAAALGVDVANTDYARFGDQWAIVIERFDRVLEGDGPIARLHQEDLCQAVGRDPSRKYEERGGPTLADMVSVVKRQSKDEDADRMALADFLIVNLVAGAPDGHSKNISLLYLPDGAWIAPLYDLATGLVYDSATVDRRVALSIGGEREVSRIRRRQWDKAAGTLGLPADAVRGRVEQLASGFPDAFAAALTAVSNAPGADGVANRALPGLTKHCALIVDHLN